MAEDNIGDILKQYRQVAVVGLSKDPEKDSYRVASFLKGRGYTVIPVNPTAESILGAKAYPSLSALPAELKKELEIVDIFRPSDSVPAIVDEALAIKEETGRPFVIWMQLGIANAAAAERAEKAGMAVIQDRCMMVEAANRKEMLRFRV